MHLTHLSLTNFRGFHSLELPLHRHLTVLVGRNGSGKSSVLDAIRNFLEADGPHEDIGLSELLSYGKRNLSLSSEDITRGQPGARIGLTWAGHSEVPAMELTYFTRDGKWSLGEQPRLGVPYIYYGRERAEPGQPMALHRLNQVWATHYVAEADEPFSLFEKLVAWAREREDIENQERVKRRSFELVDPALEAARQAIGKFLGTGYQSLRIERGDPMNLVLDKEGVSLPASSLSDGERSLIVMAGDLVRRMVEIAPEGQPVLATEAIVLIDEIELHLHPSWQQRIIESLRTTFPNAQFIVTTHSPQVLSQVPAESLRILDHFEVYSPAHPVRGRDANAILREVMGTSERPRFVQDMIEAIGRLLDQEKLDEARVRLDRLRELLGPDDSEVLRLGTALHFLETPLAEADAS